MLVPVTVEHQTPPTTHMAWYHLVRIPNKPLEISPVETWLILKRRTIFGPRQCKRIYSMGYSRSSSDDQMYAATLAFDWIRSNYGNYAMGSDGAKNPDEPIMEPVGKTFDTDASAICTSLCSFEEPVWWRSKDILHSDAVKQGQNCQTPWHHNFDHGLEASKISPWLQILKVAQRWV